MYVNRVLSRTLARERKYPGDENHTGIRFTLSILLPSKFLFLSLAMGEEPSVGQGFLIVEDSRSHSDTPHSVGLSCTSDQPSAETST